MPGGEGGGGGPDATTTRIPLSRVFWTAVSSVWLEAARGMPKLRVTTAGSTAFVDSQSRAAGPTTGALVGRALIGNEV